MDHPTRVFPLNLETHMPSDRDRIYTMGPVLITRHPIDWAELDPELDELKARTAERIDALRVRAGCHYYLNPMFTLFAPGDVPERTFLIQAQRACTLWMQQLKRVVGRARVRRFQRSGSDWLGRMLLTSGALTLGGESVHIKRLNDLRVTTHA